MSREATEFQRKSMSRMYRGREIFKPLNTGWIDESDDNEQNAKSGCLKGVG